MGRLVTFSVLHRSSGPGACQGGGGREENEFAAFGWAPQDIPDPQDAATFERSRLDWSEVGNHPHASIHAWYKSLIRLRRELPELKDGDPGKVLISHNDEEQWMVVSRGSVMVACNFSHQEREIGLYEGRRRGAARFSQRRRPPGRLPRHARRIRCRSLSAPG